MRIDPVNKEELLKKNNPEKVQAITRKVALAVAFAGVFYFFIKLLFL